MNPSMDTTQLAEPHSAALLPQDALPALAELCREHGVLFLDLFGSAISVAFDPARSDLDFVVEFVDLPGTGRADAYFGLHEALQRMFGRRVDLLTDRSIKNPYLRRSINKNHQRLFERS